MGRGGRGGRGEVRRVQMLVVENAVVGVEELKMVVAANMRWITVKVRRMERNVRR